MPRIKTIAVVIACCTGAALAQNHATTAPSQPAPAQDQAVRAQPVRVSTSMLLGRVEHKTMPVYPDEAITKGVQGDVILKIEVDEAGKITSAVPDEADPLLIAASRDALRTFRFKPYLVGGAPVRIQSQLGFHFSVEKTADGLNGKVECIASIPNRP